MKGNSGCTSNREKRLVKRKKIGEVSVLREEETHGGTGFRKE